MIDFSNKTYANILAEQIARVSNSLDKREGSVIQTALGPESWYIEGLYLLLGQLQQNSFAITAVGQYLDYKAAERGLTRNVATPAKREGIFNVIIPLGARFSTINGDASVTYYVSRQLGFVDGMYHAELTAETAGSVGNDYTGTLLPITYIQGLVTAELTTIILAGTNEEDDDSLRQRYLDSLKEQPFGGNIASYRQAILAQDDVGAVQVYPIWQGGGTVLCSILDANLNSATPELVNRIQILICPSGNGQVDPSEYGYGIAPIGAKATISTATPVTLNFAMTIQLLAGYTVASVENDINQAIDSYLLSVRKTWGQSLTTMQIIYPVNIYIAQIVAAILRIPGIINVSNVTINGNSSDLQLIETGELQELPMKGQVVING